MAKLVIGTNKQTVVPAVVRDMSPDVYREWLVDSSGYATNKQGKLDLSSIKHITQNYLLYYAFYYALYTEVDFSNLLEINANYCCRSCFSSSSIETINIGKLEKILGSDGASYMFNASKIKNISFDSLKIIDTASSFLASCTRLVEALFPKLEQVTGSNGVGDLFQSDSSLTTVDFGRLTKAKGSIYEMFRGCSSLREVKFYSLNYLKENAMLRQCQSCSDIQVYLYAVRADTFSNVNCMNNYFISGSNNTLHFPKNLDPQGGSTVISSLTSYPNFGGTNTALAFDLPSTFLLTCANSVVYERNPKYDTQTALAWRKNQYDNDGFVVDWTSVYTNTTNDPQVGDTIYSDSACTTAVTTISSIA